ncbi:hypothetical protein NS202_11940 [Mammaliicoccus sciuri]|uniref:hypothetical protein n=1 Tax=Mammaliicoccus sciuri TaxID=1296 RepID=UPI000733CB61|nr:hypothetical protein [Mammaliicoccus sciuri]KTT79840.1 hypothetical protein NS202_11940 [Mammaliicoccus sciuri]
MKLYLITLTISLIALYTFIKRAYKYASVQDEVEDSSNWKGLKKGTLYVDKQDNKISFEIEPPIDYESDKYKEAETWFSGVGRH